MCRQQQQTLLTALLSLISFFGAGIIISLPPTHATATTTTTNNDDEANVNVNAQQECTLHQDGHDNDHEDDSLFYAWSTSTPESADSSNSNSMILNALFPNLSRLQSAWEVHPLLSRVSFAQHNSIDIDIDIDIDAQQQQHDLDQEQIRIPTILHNRSSTISILNNHAYNNNNKNSDNENDPLLSLFAVDDTLTVISQPMMTHGTDYKLTKKIILPPTHPTNPGEEYSGVFPINELTIQDVLYAFNQGAFSIVIDKMHTRWESIARMAWAMEEELGVVLVNANLYLTPEVGLEEKSVETNGYVRQGFEAHWDWMDVIVVQLSGRKRWSVAREPSIYLSNKDQKRKPMNKELEQLQRYTEFTLCPGDVLYIPRGHIHNASTVIFDNMENNENGDESSNVDLNTCPSYPKELASAEHLANRLDGPSLHLTFGLLQSNEATVESLLHHALDAYFASHESSTQYEKVAIAANTPCSGSVPLVSMVYDLEWKSILHHSLAEVARRKHACDNRLSTNRDVVTETNRRCNGTGILRKSVPLLLLANNNLNDASGGKKITPQYTNLKQTYLDALDIFGSHASIQTTVDFIHSHLLKQPSDGVSDGEGLDFYYAGYSREDVISCPNLLNTLKEDVYSELLKSFGQFAKDNFSVALRSLNVWGQEKREGVRRQRLLDLEKVGQAGGGIW